jgi:hypothetical protein
MSKDGVAIRGFMRGQLVDAKTGKIVGDTGWGKNKLTNYGLTQLALGICAGTGVSVGYAALGTQTASINMTATDISHENSFVAVTTSTSGTCTATFTCSFAGSANSATLTIGSFGLFKTNSAGSMLAARTYTSSQMTTAQNFNVTHQIQFATGAEA